MLGENESISGLRLQTCNHSLKKIDEILAIDRHRGRGISRRRTFRLIEQISSIGLFAVTESNAPRTSTTTRTIPNSGIWFKSTPRTGAREDLRKNSRSVDLAVFSSSLRSGGARRT